MGNGEQVILANERSMKVTFVFGFEKRFDLRRISKEKFEEKTPTNTDKTPSIKIRGKSNSVAKKGSDKIRKWCVYVISPCGKRKENCMSVRNNKS